MIHRLVPGIDSREALAVMSPRASSPRYVKQPETTAIVTFIFESGQAVEPGQSHCLITVVLSRAFVTERQSLCVAAIS